MPKLSTEVQALRREHILDAAELCFARSGFHGTTMQDICRAAQVSAGAVYVYFTSKVALIEGIVQRDRDAVRAQMLAAADAPDFLDGLAQLMRDCILGQPVHKPALFIEIGAEAARNPLVSRVLVDCDRTLRRTLQDLLVGAMAQGRISPDVDTQTVALVLAMLADAMFLRRATDPDFDAEKIAPVIMDVVARLLGSPAAMILPRAHAMSVRTFPGVAE